MIIKKTNKINALEPSKPIGEVRTSGEHLIRTRNGVDNWGVSGAKTMH
jgi:hypothetical protein